MGAAAPRQQANKEDEPPPQPPSIFINQTNHPTREKIKGWMEEEMSLNE